MTILEFDAEGNREMTETEFLCWLSIRHAARNYAHSRVIRNTYTSAVYVTEYYRVMATVDYLDMLPGPDDDIPL